MLCCSTSLGDTLSLAQPFEKYWRDFFTGNDKCWRISVRRCIHVSNVGCAFNEYCYKRAWNATGDAQSMPRVEWTIWENNVGDICRDILTTIIGIGCNHRCNNRGRINIVCLWTQVKVIFQRHQVAKRLVGRVYCLKVTKLCASLVVPLSLYEGRRRARFTPLINNRLSDVIESHNLLKLVSPPT